MLKVLARRLLEIIVSRPRVKVSSSRGANRGDAFAVERASRWPRGRTFAFPIPLPSLTRATG